MYGIFYRLQQWEVRIFFPVMQRQIGLDVEKVRKIYFYVQTEVPIPHPGYGPSPCQYHRTFYGSYNFNLLNPIGHVMHQ